MIRRQLASTFVSLLAVAVLLPSCTDDVTTGAPSSAKAPIVIGVSLDVGKNKGASVDAILPAIHTLAYQVNAAGGIEGRPVVFEEYDDKGDSSAEAMAAMVNHFIGLGAIAILGPINSSQVTTAATVATHAIAVVSPSATAAALSSLNVAGDPWIFRTVPNDTLQVKAMVKFASSQSCSRLAVAYIDDGAYGLGVRNGLKAAWTGTYAGDVTLPSDEALPESYSSYIQKLAGMTPDCLVLIGYDDVGAPFAIQLAAARAANPTLFPDAFFAMGSDGIRTQAFIDDADVSGSNSAGSAANGFYGTAPDPNPPNNPGLTYFKKLRQQFPNYTEQLDPFAASAYDAAALVVLARVAAKSDSPTDIRNALVEVSRVGNSVTPSTLTQKFGSGDTAASMNYDGASGQVDFTDGGDVVSGFEVWHVVDGKFEAFANYPAGDFAP